MKCLDAKLAVLLLGVLPAALAIAADPFAAGNAKTGKTLHDKHCKVCHQSLAGGDGSKIYTRADRRIKSAKTLAGQVSTCNTNSGAGLFPEEETDIAAYLNQQFYKFGQ